jgi:hypothetical protein
MSDGTDKDEVMKRALDIQTRYQNWLLSKPHVVGVAVGYACVQGVPTPELALIVMVDHKYPLAELTEWERLPSQLEGVRVDVQETGQFDAFGAATVQ